MSDNVTHPNHYCKGGMECIEAIKAAVSGITDPFEAYCTGNIIKYAWRWSDKNGVEDLAKAKQYIDFIKEYREGKAKEPITTYLEEMGDEDVGEVDEGKYAGLNNHILKECVCAHFCNCEDGCPFYVECSTYKCENIWIANNPEEFRKIAITYLTEQDKAKEGEE